MSTDEAYAAFRAVRFADNGGEPFCPHCGCDAVYEYAARRIFKCKACERQFSLTSGTIFASRKLSLRDILVAIALFVNGANGHSALRLGRDLNVSYKTAFVMAHKLREVMGALRAPRKLNGIVEIDGVWVGGHIAKANLAENRKDRRGTNPKRRAIVTMRERRQGGRSLTFALQHEADAIPTVLAHVDGSATVVTDEASHWHVLAAYYDVQRINHSKAYSLDGVHTNFVESFNARIRRAERGVYHRISGQYLQAYANEISWREDHRRQANGTQFAIVMGTAARLPSSRDWRGYWQRHRRGKSPPPTVQAA